eukprot:COSAG02_NODE_3029_length_7507_cov_4.542953_4_plen_56_part_00
MSQDVWPIFEIPQDPIFSFLHLKLARAVFLLFPNGLEPQFGFSQPLDSLARTFTI